MYFYHIVRFILNIVFRVVYRFEIIGKDHIPKGGRIIICSNHISLLDPIMLAIAIPRPICFMAKNELFKNKLLAKIIYSLGAFPVNRQGSDLSAIRAALKVLEGDKILGIFPEGTRVQKMNLDNAKPGISLISIKGKSPVVPIYIESKYKLFSKLAIRIGEPIYFDKYYGKKLITEDYKKISQDIMKSIYSLKNV